MKEGYIVWNSMSYGDGHEFFGVYRTREKAERMLKKIKKARYGKMTEDEIDRWEIENGAEVHITYFSDTNGETYSIEEEE